VLFVSVTVLRHNVSGGAFGASLLRCSWVYFQGLWVCIYSVTGARLLPGLCQQEHPKSPSSMVFWGQNSSVAAAGVCSPHICVMPTASGTLLGPAAQEQQSRCGFRCGSWAATGLINSPAHSQTDSVWPFPVCPIDLLATPERDTLPQPVDTKFARQLSSQGEAF
jgi:hypothetical protein